MGSHSTCCPADLQVCQSPPRAGVAGKGDIEVSYEIFVVQIRIKYVLIVVFSISSGHSLSGIVCGLLMVCLLIDCFCLGIFSTPSLPALWRSTMRLFEIFFTQENQTRDLSMISGRSPTMRSQLPT